jgi:hypothetical protein
MSAIEMHEDISLEDVQRALADALGPGYRISATSDSSLRITRNFIIWGTVQVSWSAGETSFRVRPGGLVLVAAFNAVSIVPKIRHALDRAFPQPAE